MTIGKQGASGNLSNVLSAGGSFGLNANHAKQLVDEVREVVSGWQEIAKAQGIDAGDIQQIGWAIAHADALR